MTSGDKYAFTLGEQDRKYVEEYLNETDRSRQEGMEEIKAWIAANPKLHVKPDERSLLAFLRGSKFNLEKAKTKLTNFYEMRRDRSEWFTNRNPLLLEVQELVRLGGFVPLRQLNADNQMVVMIRVAAHDPARHPFNDMFKVGLMLLDLACEENEMAQIYGVTAIFDMSGLTFGHARQFTPGLIRNVVHSWQNYYCRPKRLEFINAPGYINVILNIFKNYMSDKLKGRVRVHFDTLDTLHDAVPVDILPKQYGGTGEDMEDLVKYWYSKLKDSSEWFAEDERYKAEH